MPITKSAKKAMRQSNARLERRKPYKTRLKSELKKVITLVKTDLAGAKKGLAEAYAVIDTAAKKNIIHKNNASRKKSMLARLIARTESGKVVAKPAKSAKKKPVAKKK